MNLTRLCKTCRHVDQTEVYSGPRYVGMKPYCSQYCALFPGAEKCDSYEQEKPYDEDRPELR